MSYYKHFKGGIYELMYKGATHSETQESLVVYRSLKDHRVWVRPEKEFFSNVVVDPTLTVARFVEMQRNPDVQCPWCRSIEIHTADLYFVCDGCDRVFHQIKN